MNFSGKSGILAAILAAILGIQDGHHHLPCTVMYTNGFSIPEKIYLDTKIAQDHVRMYKAMDFIHIYPFARQPS